MNSVPSDTKAETSTLDLQAKPSSAEKEGVNAESPRTAMDLAKSVKEPVAHIIRGVKLPNKPSPPGPEGELCRSILGGSILTILNSNRLLYVWMCTLRLRYSL